MQRLAFLLVYPLLWLISKLPYRLFYAFSEAVFVLVYYLIGYRKKVVWRNLQRAFPEKKEAELKRIRKAFYHHFCDIFLEMIKTISLSEKELKARFVLKNPEEMHRLESLGKSNVVMLGHYNSYEWVIALQLQGMKHKAYGIYKALRNPYFDKMIHDSRGKFNTHMLDKDDVARQMIRDKSRGVLASYGMVADQSPKLNSSNYWRPFFGHRVPVFVGSEHLAKRLDYAMTYLKIDKVKRGYYEAELVPLADTPKTTPDFQITDRYFDMLEAQIREHPANYLWTHKRWKHEGKEQH